MRSIWKYTIEVLHVNVVKARIRRVRCLVTPVRPTLQAWEWRRMDRERERGREGGVEVKVGDWAALWPISSRVGGALLLVPALHGPSKFVYSRNAVCDENVFVKQSALLLNNHVKSKPRDAGSHPLDIVLCLLELLFSRTRLSPAAAHGTCLYFTKTLRVSEVCEEDRDGLWLVPSLDKVTELTERKAWREDAGCQRLTVTHSHVNARG